MRGAERARRSGQRGALPDEPGAMGFALSTCKNFLDQPSIEDGMGTVPLDAYRNQGVHIRLRVDASPIRRSMGTHMHDFHLTDEFVVQAIEVVAGWEPLLWRYERYAKEKGNGNAWSARPADGSFVWPTGPRCAVPQRYVRVRIENQWVMMVVAVSAEHRSMERVLQDMEDTKDASSYAHSFNAHLVRTQGGDDMALAASEADAEVADMPKVKVACPVGCRVLSSAVPQLAHPGAVVMLFPYSDKEVKKFVFDGKQDFLELPHAFFHYAAWMAGGREMLFDLQGIEGDDNDIIIVDPVVLRAPKAGVTDLVKATVTDSPATNDGSGPSEELFETSHRTCGYLCKSFDPQRRGAKGRKMCGLDVNCGLRGGR